MNASLSRRLWNLWRTKGLRYLVGRIGQFARYRLRHWLLRSMRRLLPQNIILTVIAAFKSDTIIAYWSENSDTSTNFGDALNPILIKFLSGRNPIQSRRIFNITNKPVYAVIGSILQWAEGNRVIVWGSGFMYADSRPPRLPERVFSVRGPLSREIMLRAGVYCPEVYGDPALLCPIFYKPDVIKTHRLGIILHYLDKANSPLIMRFLQEHDVKLIDIQSGVYNVIDEINQCELIASSSLHGLIVADAYGIPSLWIRLSDNIEGGDFKFMDYFASVGRIVSGPLVITEGTTLTELISHFQKYKIKIELKQLLIECPFLHDIKKSVIGLNDLTE